YWGEAYGWGDHSTQGYLTSESDPDFAASASSGITAGDIGYWGEAYGWGDHSTQGYLTSESDPVFSASEAAAISPSDTATWNAASTRVSNLEAIVALMTKTAFVTSAVFTGDLVTSAAGAFAGCAGATTGIQGA